MEMRGKMRLTQRAQHKDRCMERNDWISSNREEPRKTFMQKLLLLRALKSRRLPTQGSQTVDACRTEEEMGACLEGQKHLVLLYNTKTTTSSLQVPRHTPLWLRKLDKQARIKLSSSCVTGKVHISTRPSDFK